MKFCNAYRTGIVGAFLLISHPLLAQEPQRPGRVAESVVGEVGQRQTDAQTQVRTEPMVRINSRVPNRVQNRNRNRIDRYYDPHANTVSPFEVATDQAQNAGSRTRR